MRDARAHAVIERFFALDHAEAAAKYVERHAGVSAADVKRLLAWRSRYFFWAGCDFFPIATAAAGNRLVLLETNSCPAGQKAMPALADDSPWGGYQRIYDTIFHQPGVGAPLAVIFDKNEQEAQSYAAVFTASSGQNALLVDVSNAESWSRVRFVGDALEVHGSSGWISVSAALRYVTEKPWLHLPLGGRTRIINPVIACLAGGRNKHLAHVAYTRFNESWRSSGLRIRTPVTRSGLSASEVVGAVADFGGCAVIKAPYGHAGEGIYPIVSEEGLAAWIALPHHDDRFVVQEMIAHDHLSASVSSPRGGTIYDLRLIVANGAAGFAPIAGFARTAKQRLAPSLAQESVRQQIVTNLSYRDANGRWCTDPTRVVPFDEENFDTLGLELDDLVDAFVQSSMAIVAIDEVAKQFVDAANQFDSRVFHLLNDDPSMHRQLAAAAC